MTSSDGVCQQDTTQLIFGRTGVESGEVTFRRSCRLQTNPVPQARGPWQQGRNQNKWDGDLKCPGASRDPTGALQGGTQSRAEHSQESTYCQHAQAKPHCGLLRPHKRLRDPPQTHHSSCKPSKSHTRAQEKELTLLFCSHQAVPTFHEAIHA